MFTKITLIFSALFLVAVFLWVLREARFMDAIHQCFGKPEVNTAWFKSILAKLHKGSENPDTLIEEIRRRAEENGTEWSVVERRLGLTPEKIEEFRTLGSAYLTVLKSMTAEIPASKS